MIDIAAIKARADKATAGPWESDTTENEGDYGSGPDCGSGFSSYEVVAKKGRICDTINSDVAMVCEEYDEDGRTAFDEVGQANMDFIAHARTDIPALLAALEASEAARVKAEQDWDALKDALTNSCDLLESYIDTFGDMSGANRADLNDYRAVLTAYDKRNA